ncbi:MAG: helix-turn-helix transcriptional regulator [Clostridiales bacterium]|nr:helix-turn-helix transcriptional regulator [Clostridiales bacterium]
MKTKSWKREKFADNLKLWRTSQGLSQKELAKKINVSFQTISHWETGYAIPSIDELVALADLFDTSLDELIGRIL